MNAMNAFWFIPLDEESEKPMAFQMQEGLLALLWAVTHPTSNVQRIALHTAMDEYIPLEYIRHKIALYANDMAVRGNTLEEIFEIYKALFTTLVKTYWHNHQIQ